MILVRAACHVHSDWSYDGKWPLERLADSFSRRGYQVVMVTEHDQGFDESRRRAHRAACQKASTDKILLLPGIEYSDPTNVIHMLVWGNVPFIGSASEPERVLTAAQDFGAVTVFAHPSRKEAWKRFNPEWKDKILGIEFWNRKTDGWAPSRHAWALLRMAGSVPFAGMDFHDARQFFPLAIFVEVEDSVSEESVLNALTARRVRSEALGLTPNAFASGPRAQTLHCLEFARRFLARVYHKANKTLE